MKEGDVFNRNTVIQDIQTITDMFADKGYAFVDIKPNTSEFLNVVNINFDISLNKKAAFTIEDDFDLKIVNYI